MLVVCTARPELLERRPGWGGGKPNALTISLSPLSDEETARPVSASCSSGRCLPRRDAGGAARPRRRQPALRRAVRAHAARARGAGAAARDGAGDHRGAARRARPAGEARSSRTPPWSGRSSGSGAARGRSRTSTAGELEELLLRARAQGVRPARARVLGRGRERVRVPPRARPRRRLRPDPAGGALGEAPPRRRVDRVARPARGPRRDARAPLPAGARAGRGRGARCGSALRTRPGTRCATPATGPRRSIRSRRQSASTTRRCASGRPTIPSGLSSSFAGPRRSGSSPPPMRSG